MNAVVEGGNVIPMSKKAPGMQDKALDGLADLEMLRRNLPGMIQVCRGETMGRYGIIGALGCVGLMLPTIPIAIGGSIPMMVPQAFFCAMLIGLLAAAVGAVLHRKHQPRALASMNMLISRQIVAEPLLLQRLLDNQQRNGSIAHGKKMDKPPYVTVMLKSINNGVATIHVTCLPKYEATIIITLGGLQRALAHLPLLPSQTAPTA